MPTDDEQLAVRAFNFLSNGHGGIDLAGLPLVAEYLGIADVEMLMHRLYVIRTHKAPAFGAPPPQQPQG